VQTGVAKQRRGYLGAGEKEFEEEKSSKTGAPLLSLIKYDVWGRTMCAKPTQSAPLLPFISFTENGPPQSQKSHLSLMVQIILLMTRFWTEFNQKNGKGVKRW
jgi:hypothetical protein